jgi:hypothetical protein
MTVQRDADTEIAKQYLLWALEEIEKIGDEQAAEYARKALEALSKGQRTVNATAPSSMTSVRRSIAKRFRLRR